MATAAPVYNPPITLPAASVTALAGQGLTGNGTALDNNLITGVAGGQTAVGGTLTTQTLTLKANLIDAMTAVVNATGLGVGGAATSLLDAFLSSSGAAVVAGIRNTSNTASSSAGFLAQVAGTSAGDAYAQFNVSGTTTWTMGADNSVSGDPFVISASAALGTTDLLSITTSGNIVSTVSTNAQRNVVLSNDSAGTSSFQTLEVRNTSSDQDSGFRMGVTGTGFSTSGMFVQDGAFFDIGQNLAGGLSIGTIHATASIRFYTGGQNLRLTISSAGLFTYGEGMNIATGTTTGTKIGTATSQKLGFFNATPIIQPTRGATLTNNVTAGGSNDVIADYSSLTTYSTDAAAIRNNIYQLARALNQHDVALRALGLLS